MNEQNRFKLLAVIELLLILLSVALDVFIPALVIIGIGAVFMLIRREKLPSLGFHRGGLSRLAAKALGLSALWTCVDYCLILPVLSHLTNTRQDVSAFAQLKGNTGLLFTMLAFGWILGAFCEEIAYRGITQNRIAGLFRNQKAGIAVAVALSSLLFGFAHWEQGIVGVIVTAVDAVFFSLLRYHYKNMWAAVFAHGFMNTIGIVVFYFTGPIYGLW